MEERKREWVKGIYKWLSFPKANSTVLDSYTPYTEEPPVECVCVSAGRGGRGGGGGGGGVRVGGR